MKRLIVSQISETNSPTFSVIF